MSSPTPAVVAMPRRYSPRVWSWQPEAERIRRDRAHMRYLDRLISMGRSSPTKRANWLKFCQQCGADISTERRRVRKCADCRCGLPGRRGGATLTWLEYAMARAFAQSPDPGEALQLYVNWLNRRHPE